VDQERLVAVDDLPLMGSLPLISIQCCTGVGWVKRVILPVKLEDELPRPSIDVTLTFATTLEPECDLNL